MNSNVSACLKDCKLFENKDVKLSNLNPAAFKNEANYQKSFAEIKEFSKSISEKEEKEINCCIYNASNDDGLFSAYVFYKYLISNDINENITFVPLSPASGNKPDWHLEKQMDYIEGRNVIICDIAYSLPNLELIASGAKKIYLIDDHQRTNKELKELDEVDKLKGRWFIGDDTHSAVAYTWKFFFPDEPVPIIIQYIDNDDRKLNLPYLFYDRAFKTYISFRITHSPYIKKFTSMEEFAKLHKQVENIDRNFILTVGHYYDELVNNIKDQVARNASFQYFQGHPVYVLNYNDPVLYKMVARQMITNAEKAGKNIDFAVLWGWEYTTNAYKVFLSEKHTGKPPKYNLSQLAQKLGKKGGHPMGGKGTKYIGNFYWPRKKGQDIWDLFVKS
jgi:oligoribonuclease NrnB/cAMP/cGMP phosphodiesterase (DHH superfamily)